MAIPEDIRRLLEDAEYFVGEVLHNEKLSKKAKDKREALLDGFRQMKYRYQQELQLKGDSGDWVSRHEDSSDDNQSLTYVPSGLSDSVSVASENQEDVQFEDIPLVAAQDLSSILKQGYLEKKRRDHSFFGSEWRRRFCVLNKNIFHFYNSEKDKQQKDAFYVSDAQLVQNLRKDSKKNSCFEVLSSDKKVYQFTAPSVREAKDWVDHISFVLKDMNSNFIPLEEEVGVEEEDEDQDNGLVMYKEEALQEETYDDVDTALADQRPSMSHPPPNVDMNQDDEIYEELPEDDFPPPIPLDEEMDHSGDTSINFEDYYLGLWDCTGQEEDELSFKRGDMVHILSKDYNSYGWWVGEMEGIIGIVPKEFLMPAYDI